MGDTDPQGSRGGGGGEDDLGGGVIAAQMGQSFCLLLRKFLLGPYPKRRVTEANRDVLS